MPEPLTRWRDKHRGKPAAVIGAGPSLHNLQPGQLDGFVAIAVNSAILKVPYADYYFSCDGTSQYRPHWYALKDLTCTLFLHGLGGYTLEHATKAGIDPERIFWYARDETNGGNLQLHPKADVTIVGKNSAHPATHLAVIFGCSPIVLLGCDCSWVGGKFHFTDFEDEPDNDKLPEFFRHDHTHQRQRYENRPDNTQCAEINAWNRIAKRNKDIAIYNASGGCLDAFPRIKMSALPDIVPVT